MDTYKKGHQVHKLLLILIAILGVGLFFEFSRQGIKWFNIERRVDPKMQTYMVVKPDEFEGGDPYLEMERLQRSMYRWFNRVYGGVTQSKTSIVLFEPNIDIQDRENEYLVFCDLPGMSKDEIEVSIKGSYLAISGIRNIEQEKDKDDYYFRERNRGSFKRVIMLPEPVIEKDIKAEYNNGILEIKIPKIKAKETNKVKKIHVI